MQLQQEIETELKMKTTDHIKKARAEGESSSNRDTQPLAPFSKPISEKVWLAAWGKMKEVDPLGRSQP